MRGFPEFVESIIPILENNNDIEVAIAGQDKIIYGGVRPKEGTFWLWAKKRLKKYIDKKQISYFGHLKLIDYARLLKSSHAHIYLTRPFVASWSLLEAMASGCTIVANKLELVEEIASKDDTFWCDLSNIDTISTAIEKALRLDDAQRESNGLAQRNIAEQHWDQEKSFREWCRLIGVKTV